MGQVVWRPSRSPKWCSFLQTITQHDDDLALFLQRMCGYWLTGHVKEQKLFFLWGPGANGKSVFVNTIAGIMGTYAIPAPISLLVHTPGIDRYETEKAWLAGCRLAHMSEPSEGQEWDESKVKELTGEVTLEGRFLYGNRFKFPMQCKLVISGNNKPTFANVDEAIRRRVLLIPFTAVIPPHQRDPNLMEKLKGEWPAVLSWAICGASDWYANGLDPPEIITTASSEYIEEQDDVAIWLDERVCCDEAEFRKLRSDDEFAVSNQTLFLSWLTWAKKHGVAPGSAKRLFARVEKLGHQRYRKKHERGFKNMFVRLWDVEKGDSVTIGDSDDLLE